MGFRDQFAFLSPRNGVSPPYRPFPGLLGDIIHRSRTSHTLSCGESDDPFSSQPSSPLSIAAPEVVVTPDTRVVDHGYHNFWVAVEITATKGKGCLCDIEVDIEPTAPKSAILEVIKNFAAPTSISSSGSAILVLVNVELNLANYSRSRGHIRSSSDDLIEDLEDQLGSAQCEYLRVSLIYQHSAFAPGIRDSNRGVTRAQTKIRTVYTAAMNRHNSASLWSPPPTPAPNHRLLGIIASH